MTEKIKKLFALVLALVLFGGTVACKGGEQSGTDGAKTDAEISDFTLLVYICGSDLEQKRGAATANIAEMLSADIPDGVNVILQTGGSSKWRNFDIPSDRSNRYAVKNGTLELIESNPPVNMGSERAFSDFLKFGLEKYPAEQTAVVFWNHGGGSAVGVCSDALNGNDFLTLSEISSALESVGLKKKLSFVGFDACLMANYETARILAPYAEKMIASEELEPSGGWDWKKTLENLSDPTEIAKGYAEKNADTDYYTVSVIDLEKFGIVEDLFSRVVEKIGRGEKNLFARAAYYAQGFGSSSGKGDAGDLYDLCGVADYLDLEYDLSDCVTCFNGTARADAGGLSFYFPVGSQKYMEAYTNGVATPAYGAFLKEYFSSGNAAQIAFENRGEVRNGKLWFSVTPESENIVCSVCYTLYRVDMESLLNGKYKLWGIGYDTDIVEKGNEYAVNFVGNWAFLNGCQLNCDVVDETENHTFYSSVIRINGALSYLLFTFDKNSREISLSGYVNADSEADRIEPLKDGDVITVMYDVFSDDLQTASFTEGETFEYSSAEMPLSIGRLDNDAYIFQALVTDIYGKTYPTNFALAVMSDGEFELVDVIKHDTNLDDE